ISSDILVVTSLGRPFTLGMLYDARQDRLIPGKRSYKGADKLLLFNTPTGVQSIEAEVSNISSCLPGLLEVEGSAKYLNDTKKYQNQSRVMLQYKATTNFIQLMTNLGTKHIGYSESFENIQATHVVIGILYGANAFFAFDSDKVDASNVQEIQGRMEAVIKKIPSVEISGQGAVQLTDEENAITNNFSCRFHGKYQIPQMIGKEKAVPMTIWLVQLTNFYFRAPQMAADSSTPKLRKVHNKQVSLFPRIKKNLYNFQNLCNDYMLNLRQVIAKTESPFNIESLNKWLECEEREINVIRSCTDIIEGAKAKTVSSKSEMIRELLESKVQPVYVCFLVAAVENGILIIDEFNRPYMPPVETIQARRELFWYDCELTLDSDTVHLVLTLSEDNKKVKSWKRQPYKDQPERFDIGRHYREVEWLGYVCAGVTYRGIRRKTWRLGVYLDWPAGNLSYYTVSTNLTLPDSNSQMFCHYGLHSSSICSLL
uniref:SPRY-associated domain-containing protein n=1 Tax=Seriola lalandi dorsalis TaxID=1841481 RepID=A0A3B4XYQ9_SERLL